MTEILNYIKWAYRGRWESKKQKVTANTVACITSIFSFLNDISAHLHYINLSIKHLPYVTLGTAHCIAYHTSLTPPGMVLMESFQMPQKRHIFPWDSRKVKKASLDLSNILNRRNRKWWCSIKYTFLHKYILYLAH